MPKDSKKAKSSKSNTPRKLTYREVFDRILNACSKGQKEVYSLLDKYQDSLTDNFALMVREHAGMKLRRLSGKKKNNLRSKLWRFNLYIVKFPRGNRASQIEIAIAISKLLINTFPRSTFPKQWAALQNMLGGAYEERIRGDRYDNLELAIAAFQAALKIYTREAFPESWAAIQFNLGIVYRAQEKFDPAISAYQLALEFRTREASPKNWASTQNNLGAVYTDQRKFDLAITACQAALEIYTRETFLEDWARVQGNLGNTFCQAGQFREAISCSEAGLEIYTRKAFPEEWAKIQYNLATAYRDLGELNQAITYFRASLEVFAPTAFPERRLQSGRDFGDAAFAAERWQSAIEGYTAAMEAVEVSCSWASNNQHRSEILQEAMDVYTKTVQACLNNNQPELALEYVERSKARNLVQLFADSKNKSHQIRSDVLNRLEKIKKQILENQQELNNIREDSGQQTTSIVSNIVEQLFPESDETEFTDQPTNEEQADNFASNNSPNRNQVYARDLRTKLEELQEEFNQVLEKIIELDPVYALTQAVQPIRYQEIIEQLDERTAIIEWYLTEQGFYTFLITKDFEKPEVWQFTKDELEQLNQWQQAYLEDYNQHKYFQWRNALNSRLEELANILHLQEILDKVPENCNQLILVPHSYLHLLPLHALPINTDNCLLNHFPEGIRCAPSCQLLQLSQKRSSVETSKEIAKNLFAIQNPTEDLNFTNVEVEAIHQYFDKSYILARHEANKGKWNKNQTQKHLEASNFVHFSCHSYFNFDEPLSSPLVLSGSRILTTSISSNESLRFIESPDQQSYELSKCLLLKEIFNLDLLPCRLVTLSACETCLSSPESWGDEYIGLPSGFLVAGSPSVVGSQWAVSDISTAILMIKFYENLMAQLEEEKIDNLNQLSVSKALNSAQLWLRSVTKTDLLAWLGKFNLDAERQKELERDLKLAARDQPYAEPIYWAAFCAIGQ